MKIYEPIKESKHEEFKPTELQEIYNDNDTVTDPKWQDDRVAITC